MLERHVVIPASPEKLWDALTEPAAVSAWFGSHVDWELRPGGQARFVDDDGTTRRGVIDAVEPTRHLSFRWWREDATGDPASQVTYRLEPEEDGTRLTVTERLVPDPPVSARRGGAASASSAGNGRADAGWTGWDSRLFGCWAQALAARVGQVGG